MVKPFFYFPFEGGKYRELKHIKPYIKKDFTKILEPFCGSSAFSISMKNENANLEIHINDIDTQLMNFFNFIKSNTSLKLFEKLNQILSNYTPETHKEQIVKYNQNNFEATLDNIFSYLFYMKIRGFRKSLFDLRRPVSSIISHSDFLHLDNTISTFNLYNQNYLDIMSYFKNDENALIFLDPPYFDSNNEYYLRYKEETKFNLDNSAIYVDILNFMKECKCGVIMVVNGLAIMKELYTEFLIDEYDKTYGSCKRTTHIIIGVNLDI